MTRWAFNASDYIAALGGDPTYAGMELGGDYGMPVLPMEVEHTTRPLFATMIGRVTDTAHVTQFSEVEFTAPTGFGVWLERISNEGASILQLGFSQDQSSTPINPPTAEQSVLVGPDGVQDHFTGAALVAGTGSLGIVQSGQGSANSEPVSPDEVFQIAAGAEFSSWSPLWLPAGRHCYVFGPAVNTAITVSWLIRLPAALLP